MATGARKEAHNNTSLQIIMQIFQIPFEYISLMDMQRNMYLDCYDGNRTSCIQRFVSDSTSMSSV